MKKRILGTGVALLMATNIFANVVSAQGIDGESPLAEAKKTTEENITLSAAPVIRGTAWQMDSSEMWKLLHCAFVKQGLLWNKPVSDYANPTTCGNIDTSPLILALKHSVVSWKNLSKIRTKIHKISLIIPLKNIFLLRIIALLVKKLNFSIHSKNEIKLLEIGRNFLLLWMISWKNIQIFQNEQKLSL